VLVTIVVTPETVTGADAVMLVAPAESTLMALMLMVAMPLEFVRAVAETGEKVVRLLVEEAKETTVPDTAFPSASLRVAVTVTGVPIDTMLEERLKLSDGEEVVVVLLPVSVPSALLPHPARQLNKTKEIKRNNMAGNFAFIDFTMLLSFKSTDDIFRISVMMVIFIIFYDYQKYLLFSTFFISFINIIPLL
jgi:hypothetical protein